MDSGSSRVRKDTREVTRMPGHTDRQYDLHMHLSREHSDAPTFCSLTAEGTMDVDMLVVCAARVLAENCGLVLEISKEEGEWVEEEDVYRTVMKLARVYLAEDRERREREDG